MAISFSANRLIIAFSTSQKLFNILSDFLSLVEALKKGKSTGAIHSLSCFSLLLSFMYDFTPSIVHTYTYSASGKKQTWNKMPHVAANQNLEFIPHTKRMNFKLLWEQHHTQNRTRHNTFLPLTPIPLLSLVLLPVMPN